MTKIQLLMITKILKKLKQFLQMQGHTVLFIN
jgi:hypothetical protein